ncbi:MAG: hypothetical protein ABR860_16590 [Terracidiphilus sp.]|jgi:hypothetical protein
MRFPSKFSLVFIAAVLLGTTAVCASGVAGAAAAAAARPAQTLTPYIFPDGSGSMGLPPGWMVIRAQLGDVTAQGPNGERLRFGLVIPVIDPTSPQAGVLMAGGGAPGSVIAVPYNADAATLFTQGSEQVAQRLRLPPPTITIQSTRNLPANFGGKNFAVYGLVDAHDGRGAQAMVTQMIVTPPQALGAYQVTVFEITAPPQVMANDAATITEIYTNYNRNTQFVMAAVNAQIEQSEMREQQILDAARQESDQTEKSTAGFSNILLDQTVIRNTQTGEHFTVSNQRADWLTRHNPYLFEEVPESDYIKGIDY